MPETTKPLLDDPKVLIDMMDNAEGQISLVSKAVADQREIAADVSLSLEERLEAYEDIIDSEVGDTNMTRAR
ncbi:MAG: threonine synthase, partial [Calditrichaeota bacterium]|nr:threonine synthase [Calditrichota bacterium]